MRYLLHAKPFVTNKYTLDFSNMLFVGKSLRYSSLDTLINKFQAQCTESLVCRDCIRKWATFEKERYEKKKSFSNISTVSTVTSSTNFNRSNFYRRYDKLEIHNFLIKFLIDSSSDLITFNHQLKKPSSPLIIANIIFKIQILQQETQLKVVLTSNKRVSLCRRRDKKEK